FSTIILAVELINEDDIYQADLVKFYLEKGEYKLALLSYDALDYEPTDSLMFMQCKALAKLDSAEAAVNSMTKLIMKTENNLIKISAISLINEVLANLPPLRKIEILTKALENTNPDEIEADLLLILAEIYESLRLFSEANDIYQTILYSQITIDSSLIKLRVVVNKIQMKDYQDAIVDLNEVVQDSLHREEALFFQYISHSSLENKDEAKQALLRLFTDYPDSRYNKEVMEQLANVYRAEKQYIMSWYFFQQLLNVSDEIDKVAVEQEIELLKKKLSSGRLETDQFKFLAPNLFEKN
ncbi:MAG: hypothetical protein KAS49_06225, partial [Candidatus Cloacimonetes bacterium]|nr:hypothetical protein [Candidatus Cloacimonadota bacterium]